MTPRAARCRALAAGALVLLTAACSRAVDGAAPSSSVVTLPSSSSSAAAPSSPTSSTPAPLGSCRASADFCDDFSDDKSGWLIQNETNYYSAYSPYLGGTYRVGERTAHVKTQLAPVDTTTLSRRGVKLDVDGELGNRAPSSSYVGLVCWDHQTSSGQEAGFLFFVTANSVDITLLDDEDGTPHAVAGDGGTGFVKPYPTPFHLTATCEQVTVDGVTQARLSLAIDGKQVLAATYDKSVKNFSWSPGPKAGVLVAGKSSDVFYDNFTVTGL